MMAAGRSSGDHVEDLMARRSRLLLELFEQLDGHDAADASAIEAEDALDFSPESAAGQTLAGRSHAW